MNDAPPEPSTPPAPPVQAPPDANAFLRALLIVTLGLLLLVLIVYLLEKFQVIFQPLFIAIFLGYLLLPLHHWLEGHGVPSPVAYGLILVLILGSLFGLGTVVFFSFERFRANLPAYEEKADALLQRVLEALEVEDWKDKHLRDYLQAGDSEQMMAQLSAAVGIFTDFFTGLVVTFVYFVFLVAEKVSFGRRLGRAFGEQRAQGIRTMGEGINQSITQYLAVKTLTGALAAFLSLAVLALFGIDFYVLWAFLIFLLNYIPYLGSLVAVALPILLSLLQLESIWSTLVLALLLITIQEVIGMIVEPRMAGRRLGVSPLLILLALAFWGRLWGIIGMILAVPLLVVIKAVLQSIKETQPLATLMSNE